MHTVLSIWYRIGQRLDYLRFVREVAVGFILDCDDKGYFLELNFQNLKLYRFFFALCTTVLCKTPCVGLFLIEEEQQASLAVGAWRRLGGSLWDKTFFIISIHVLFQASCTAAVVGYLLLLWIIIRVMAVMWNGSILIHNWVLQRHDNFFTTYVHLVWPHY